MKINLFISHDSNDEKIACLIAKELKEYGINCFVAHPDIHPMKDWKNTIIEKLKSSDIVIALINDDYFNKVWTNQEIGFACKQETPILPIKLSDKNPEGMISNLQALRSDALKNDEYNEYTQYNAKEDSEKIVLNLPEIFPDININKLYILKFIHAKNYNDAIDYFKIMKKQDQKLDNDDVKLIIDGFHNNNQLHPNYLKKSNVLTDYLEEQTGNKYKIINGKITQIVGRKTQFHPR
ncbi:MAG: hypothetical protein P857_971 [Candidatus Xenolissoclinum pacificiensis L6]|uniref:TIR domain-containing protein n=1 Tax=Candidatus Xenolissoclinum pacificiensis L6 TaxID=1401685 RepID=W2V0M3_9RICK|nr:MAG: hypothetical protein P857_971 [Candidatus Xenolissoclinum pacificiensis L6]